MIYETKQINDQFNKATSYLNNYTNDIFGLFSSITKEMEKITKTGMETLEVVVASSQKISKESITSATTSSSAVIKEVQEAFKGGCETNFFKKA